MGFTVQGWDYNRCETPLWICGNIVKLGGMSILYMNTLVKPLQYNSHEHCKSPPICSQNLEHPESSTSTQQASCPG